MYNKHLYNAYYHAQNAMKHASNALYSTGKLGLVTAAAVIPGFETLSGRVVTERAGVHVLKAVSPCEISSNPIFCSAGSVLDGAAYCLYNYPVTSLGTYVGAYWYVFHYDLIKSIAVSTANTAKETFYAAKECVVGMHEVLTSAEETENTYINENLTKEDDTISTKASSEITEDDTSVIGEINLAEDFH